MKDLRTSGRFRRDLKRVQKRHHAIDRLEAVINQLREGESLAPRLRDHELQGEWRGSRECHVAPDWLLIYETTEEEVILQRTGTHSDLFGE